MPGFFDLNDPQTALPLLGLLAGIGQAAQPSRYPVGIGATLGMAAQGYMGGKQSAQEYAQRQNALAMQNLQMNQQLGLTNYIRQQNNLPAITLQDLQKGNFGGPSSTEGTPTTPAPASSFFGSPSNQTYAQVESHNNPQAVNPVSGATGSMQTMPSTLANPGFGVVPAKDNSAAEQTRVGQDYHAAMVSKYGDPVIGAIAYNWGPGNTDKWLASGADFSKLPDETQKYVGRLAVASRVGAGQQQVAQNLPAVQPQSSGLPPIAQFMPPEQIVGMMEKQLTPISQEDAAKIPGTNPNSSYARDFYGNIHEVVKSDVKSPAAQQQELDISKAQAQARSEAALDTINQVAPGYVDNAAQAIASYRQAPEKSLGRNNILTPAIMAKVYQINPNYDAKNFASAQQTLTAFDKGKQGDTVRALNVGIQHLGVLGQTAQALGNGDVRAINALKQTFQDQFGSPIPNNFNAVRNIVADEVTKAILGGAGALGDREEIRKTLMAANSPQQLAGVVQNYIKLMAGQMQGLRQQFISGSKLPASEFDSRLLPATTVALGSLSGAPAPKPISSMQNKQSDPLGIR